MTLVLKISKLSMLGHQVHMMFIMLTSFQKIAIGRESIIEILILFRAEDSVSTHVDVVRSKSKFQS